jgi:hypothetical protein
MTLRDSTVRGVKVVELRHVRDALRGDRPEIGVLVPPMVWAEASGHSADSGLLVLASHGYDPGDYIRDYTEFLSIMRETAS